MNVRLAFAAAVAASLAAHALLLLSPGRGRDAGRELPPLSQRYPVRLAELPPAPPQRSGGETVRPTPRTAEHAPGQPAAAVEAAPRPERQRPEAPVPAPPRAPSREVESVPHSFPAHLRPPREGITARRESRSAPDGDNEREASGGRAEESRRLLQELRRGLREALRYPETARRKGIEGTLVIELTIDVGGRAENLAVTRSSGSRILDRAAVRALQGLLPFPDPPAAPLRLSIPVVFRLAER